MSPRISVALCTHNGAAFLEPQLESLAAQSRLPDELVVCDDDSGDETVSQVQRFAARAPFPVHVHRNRPALGVTANFARAFGLCTGDILFSCDQDDVWHPDKIAELTRAFDDDRIVLAFSDLQIVDQAGRPSGLTQWQALGFDAHAQVSIATAQPWEQLLRFNVVTGAAMAFSARLRDRILPVPESWIHDEWISLIAAATGRLSAVHRPLVHYRRHNAQQIGAAVNGMWAQFQHARENMGAAYVRRLLVRAEALQTRVATFDPPAGEAFITALGDRIRHLRRRVDLREEPGLRVQKVAREWLNGRYRRFGYGWKSAAQDLFL